MGGRKECVCVCVCVWGGGGGGGGGGGSPDYHNPPPPPTPKKFPDPAHTINIRSLMSKGSYIFHCILGKGSAVPQTYRLSSGEEKKT